MLAIRLQRTGRSGHTQFRVIVQDSHFSPTRGRIVAYLGNYDPHTKTANIDGEKASQYLTNGAQPSDRVARLFQKEGIKLPNWVKLEEQQTGSTRNPEKRRSTRPAEPEAPITEAPAEETPVTEEVPDVPAEETAPEEETPAEKASAPEEDPEAPAEEPAAAEPEASPEEPAAKA